MCLSLRLVFEQQLFGYYYLALSVSLLLLDVVRGRIRVSLVAWLATMSMVYVVDSDALQLLRSPWSNVAEDLIPLAVIALAIALIVDTVRRRGRVPMLVFWFAMIAAALIVWDETDVLGLPPTWFWQVVFVPLGIVLAARPLLGEVRAHGVVPDGSVGHTVASLP